MDVARSAPAKGLPPAVALATVTLLAGVAVAAGALTGVGDSPAAQTFVVIFTSIVVEALPFILLGALVSALIAVFVPQTAFERAARLPVPAQLPLSALGGLAFPVCECGSVPVARRLIARGIHPAAGLAFMLAAPVLNPIVLASTAIAYRGRGVVLEMVAGRAALGLLLAILAGWALATGPAARLLRPRAEEQEEPAHENGRATGLEIGRPGETSAHRHGRGERRAAFVDHLTSDFTFMGRFVVIGAALAAALQTVIPQSVAGAVARTPVLGSLALMALAFVLSLCSEADAFVAVSFSQFPLSSQLAFLVFGPVVDAKLAFLYGATFRGRFVGRLIAVAVPVVLAGSLWFEVVVR